MATTKFDARAVIDYIEGLEHQISLYETKANDLREAYNELINLESFEGETAEAVKTLTKDVQIELLESVVNAQKIIKAQYTNTLEVFQENVDSSDDALIEISVLEEIHNDYSEKQKIFEAHATNIENIAYAIQQKYGDLYPVTQPDFTDCRNDFKALVGDDTTKGIFQKTIDALEEFDYSETQRIKNLDIDSYLDDLDLKITRLQNLLDDSTVLATDYVMVNQYIDAFKNDSFLDDTFADKVFAWMECSDDEKLKKVVSSKYYKNIKLYIKAAATLQLSHKQGLRLITGQLDILGKNIKDFYKKHSEKIAEVTVIGTELYTGQLYPLFLSLTMIDKIFPDSEFTKKCGNSFSWMKSFVMGGQTCIIDMGAGILSLPETVMDLIDAGDNAINSAADYIRHNGLKTNSEHTKRRIRDTFQKLEDFTSEKIDVLEEKVKDMSVDDAFFGAGYAFAFLFSGAAIKEAVEAVRGVESVAVGAEAVEDVEIIVEGTEATKDAEIIIESAEAAEEAEIAIESAEVAEEGAKAKKVAKALEKLSKPSSSKLRKNLIKAGVKEPDYPHAAHHIVAGNSPKAEEAREILLKYGIDINDAENGVFLPTVKEVGGAYHPSLHTNEYYRKINSLLRRANSREDALDILDMISEELLEGVF